jgi:hypothetical protein
VLAIVNIFLRFSSAVQPRFSFCRADVMEILEERFSM